MYSFGRVLDHEEHDGFLNNLATGVVGIAPHYEILHHAPCIEKFFWEQTVRGDQKDIKADMYSLGLSLAWNR